MLLAIAMPLEELVLVFNEIFHGEIPSQSRRELFAQSIVDNQLLVLAVTIHVQVHSAPSLLVVHS